MSAKALVRAFLRYRFLLRKLQAEERAWDRLDRKLRNEFITFGTTFEQYLARSGIKLPEDSLSHDSYWLKYRAEVDRGLTMADLQVRDSLVLKEISREVRAILLKKAEQITTWYLQNKFIIVCIRKDFRDTEILFHDRCDSSDVQKLVKDALEIIYPEVIKKYDQGIPIEIHLEKGKPVGVGWTFRGPGSAMAHPSTAEKKSFNKINSAETNIPSD